MVSLTAPVREEEILSGNQRSLREIAGEVCELAALITMDEFGHALPEEVERGLVALAGEVVSRNEDYLALGETFGVLRDAATRVSSGADLDSVVADVRRLIGLRIETALQVPVLHLRLDRERVALGVTLSPFSVPAVDPNPLEKRMAEQGDALSALAEVTCRGDREHARLDLVQSVERLLRIMNGAVWQIYGAPLVAGPMLFGGPTGGAGVFYKQTDSPHFNAWHAGAGRLEHPFIWPDSWIYFGRGRDALLGVLSNGPTNPTEQKLLLGLEWLGEAAALGSARSRYLRIGAALEALVGTDELARDGIIAGLAERVAQLVGSSIEERLDVDGEVRRLYGLRSQLIHGKIGDVRESDVARFGDICHRTAIGLAARLDEIGDNLPQWAKHARYSDHA